MDAVSANLSANLLGLGNAATPLGLEASRLMAERTSIYTAVSRPMRGGMIRRDTFSPFSAPSVRAPHRSTRLTSPHRATASIRKGTSMVNSKSMAYLHTRANSLAAVIPTVTDTAEASHTAGRMSKGFPLPAAARREATVVGMS